MLNIIKIFTSTFHRKNNITFMRTIRCLSTLNRNPNPRSYGLLPPTTGIAQCRVSIFTTVSSWRTIKKAEYKEIKDLPKQPEKILIDVREPNELNATGKIPTSINIPLTTVIKELGSDTSPSEFQSKYGRKKPDEDTVIIFSCLKGIRSLEAAEIATGLGFKNVKNYEGSWEDWAKHEELIK